MIKCADIMDGVVDEATKSFSLSFVEDPVKKENLSEICCLVDEMTGECVGDYQDAYIDIAVDNETTNIIIAIGCEEFEAVPDSAIFQLAKRSKEIKFRKIGDVAIEVQFVFDGIWIRRVK